MYEIAPEQFQENATSESLFSTNALWKSVVLSFTVGYIDCCIAIGSNLFSLSLHCCVLSKRPATFSVLKMKRRRSGPELQWR